MFAGLLRALLALSLLTFSVGAVASATLCVQQQQQIEGIPGAAMPADCPDRVTADGCVTACGSACLALAYQCSGAERARAITTAKPALVPATLRDWKREPEPPPPRSRFA